MKRISIYINFALLFLLITAEQCSESRDVQVRETILEQRIKGIRTQLETDFLSEAMLYEYEKSAVQKLSDLADLFKILGDASKEHSFRAKAGDMILKSFVSEHCIVKILTEPESEGTVGSVIHSGLNNQISLNRWGIDSLRSIKPFTRTGENSYQTSMGFRQYTGGAASGEQVRLSRTNEIEVLINRQIKVLGEDSLWVWALQFGNIK